MEDGSTGVQGIICAKHEENSPDTSTCDSTVQTVNTVTFIMCPAVRVPTYKSTSMLKIDKR